MFSVVVNPDNVELEIPNCVRISPEFALEHFFTISEVSDRVKELFLIVVPDYDFEHRPWPPTSDPFRRLIGLIDLTVKLLNRGGIGIRWQYPETGLHPKHQVNLADLAIELFVEKKNADDKAGSDGA